MPFISSGSFNIGANPVTAQSGPTFFRVQLQATYIINFLLLTTEYRYRKPYRFDLIAENLFSPGIHCQEEYVKDPLCSSPSPVTGPYGTLSLKLL
jgi:hypothetical protein